VHSEANAIISASRKDMIGATLYLVGRDAKTKEYVRDANSCSMCKRLIINSGISHVIIRDSKEDYRETSVDSWIDDDDSLRIVKDAGY
jgi:dCMP deaminase